TVSMLCGLTHPDRGSVTIAGARVGGDASPVKRRLGLVTQEVSVYEDLCAFANLELFGSLYGLAGALLRERCASALAFVGLSAHARSKPSTFSGGMKRRLNIACALVHDPDVLLLDEPTVGVDPQSRNAIFETLESLSAAGHTLIYTTHYMEEVERLCERVVIIDHGRVLAADTVDALLKGDAALSRLMLEYDPVPDRAARAALAALPGVRGVAVEGSEVTLTTADLGAVAPRALELLAAHGLSCRRLATRAATLEDVFLSLTGRRLRDP
ncbi:MAG TPA: ATP-binding cassette domain-containing protein, partial [Steroidobacteraceae bacterium]|nr:ATP-binding cassette domain-containing protein [Steroidobacteraceae bacterium]